MSRFLLVDIGAGTMDVLCYDDGTGVHYKAVVKSPVIHLAEALSRVQGDLLVTGCEMGGGPVSQVLRRRAGQAEVVMTTNAAATLHHDPAKVREWGIRIVSDQEAALLAKEKKYSTFKIGDLEVDRLRQIVEGFGVPFAFDVVGMCAQDHGVPPKGVSHLDYRHSLFKERLDRSPFPQALLYERGEVPATFNRLFCLAESAALLPAGQVFVMDSGMAAILGASVDNLSLGRQRIMILDVATSHTLGAALDGGELAGFFEYHTRDITLDRLESLLGLLAEGRLEHAQVLKEGGHGAYLRKAVGLYAGDVVVATGPKRALVLESKLPMVFGAPLGDNMMTGTVGLLEAIRRRKNLAPVRYV